MGKEVVREEKANAQCLQQLCHDEADIRKPPSFALSAQSLSIVQASGFKRSKEVSLLCPLCTVSLR